MPRSSFQGNNVNNRLNTRAIKKNTNVTPKNSTLASDAELPRILLEALNNRMAFCMLIPPNSKC